MINVGNVIREARKKKNWSRKQLAKASTVHFNTIGAVERGEREMNLPTLQTTP